MKGVWHHWMQQSSSNTTRSIVVRSDFIPFGMKVYAQVNLSYFLVGPAYTGNPLGGGKAGGVISAYGLYTDRESWRAVHLEPSPYSRNFLFEDHCAWVEATLWVTDGEAVASLSILGY
jgi:hypothetical protein